MKAENEITRELNGGTQRIGSFPNGYGYSIVLHSYSYGHENGLFELAVLCDFKDDAFEDFELCYDTDITDDVIGHLTPGECDELVKRISELSMRGN